MRMRKHISSLVHKPFIGVQQFPLPGINPNFKRIPFDKRVIWNHKETGNTVVKIAYCPRVKIRIVLINSVPSDLMFAEIVDEIFQRSRIAGSVFAIWSLSENSQRNITVNNMRLRQEKILAIARSMYEKQNQNVLDSFQ